MIARSCILATLLALVAPAQPAVRATTLDLTTASIADLPAALRQAQINQIRPVTGLPCLEVPRGFTADGLPSGFEAVTKNRQLPKTTPPLPGETITY